MGGGWRKRGIFFISGDTKNSKMKIFSVILG